MLRSQAQRANFVGSLIGAIYLLHFTSYVGGGIGLDELAEIFGNPVYILVYVGCLLVAPLLIGWLAPLLVSSIVRWVRSGG